MGAIVGKSQFTETEIRAIENTAHILRERMSNDGLNFWHDDEGNVVATFEEGELGKTWSIVKLATKYVMLTEAGRTTIFGSLSDILNVVMGGSHVGLQAA